MVSRQASVFSCDDSWWFHLFPRQRKGNKSFPPKKYSCKTCANSPGNQKTSVVFVVGEVYFFWLFAQMYTIVLVGSYFARFDEFGIDVRRNVIARKERIPVRLAGFHDCMLVSTWFFKIVFFFDESTRRVFSAQHFVAVFFFAAQERNRL